MAGIQLIIKTVSQLVLCLLATVATAQNSGIAQQYPYETQCAMKDWRDFLAFRLAPLVVPYAEVFVCPLDNGTCYSQASTIGSYELTNASHDGLGRVYHDDIYRENTHSTYVSFEDPFDYQAARTIALEVLQ